MRRVPRKYKVRAEDGRVVAVRDFGSVRAGDVGGFLEYDGMLSHKGNCWIYDDALVTGGARVVGDAQIRDNAIVHDGAIVRERAVVSENAIVQGQARIGGNKRVALNQVIGKQREVASVSVLRNGFS